MSCIINLGEGLLSLSKLQVVYKNHTHAQTNLNSWVWELFWKNKLSSTLDFSTHFLNEANPTALLIMIQTPVSKMTEVMNSGTDAIHKILFKSLPLRLFWHFYWIPTNSLYLVCILLILVFRLESFQDIYNSNIRTIVLWNTLQKVSINQCRWSALWRHKTVSIAT